MNQNLEHFRNLVSLAAIDGIIQDIERITLSKIAYEKGISVERMNIMLKHADEYAYLIPQNVEERDTQLKEMIDFALVDGDFAQAERGLIMSVGEKLGFTKEELNLTIDKKLALEQQ
jgi:uncharacterized tellurite resistance protein B-like protein